MNRNTAKTFEDLIVWQKAHAFVLSIYSFSGTFPKHEIFGLTSQFRRAAVSIPANIAEGFRKKINALLEEVSKMLSAYLSSLLNTEFSILDSSIKQPNSIKR